MNTHQQEKCPLCRLPMAPWPFGNFPNILYCEECRLPITTDGNVPRELRD